MSWFKKIAIHEWLTQIPSGRYIWQIHLDMFFDIAKQTSPELAGSEFGEETGFVKNEPNRKIFSQWLQHVPKELKMGDDLEPSFKNAVREYLRAKYGFDPYEYEQGEEVGTPSIEEMEEWFR